MITRKGFINSFPVNKENTLEEDRTDKRPMLIEKQLKIMGYDIDVMGIVSNIVYVKWFEDLRFLFLDTYWSFEKMLESGQSPILAKTEIEYKSPLTIHDKSLGRLWIEHMGKAKWHTAFEIVTDKKIHCTGRQYGYIYDLHKKKPVAFPAGLREQYEKETGITV